MRRFARCAFAAALALGAASCTRVNVGVAGRTNAFTTPHVLRYAMDLEVPGLNPHLFSSASVGYLAQMTMAWLVRYDRHDRPEPELATVVPSQQNGGVSRDGLTITWHLRHGVRWSDGAPFSSADVVFSVRAVLNPANNEIGRNHWDQIASVEAAGPDGVVFHMKKPVAIFEPSFFGSAGGNPCILPQHLLASLPNINTAPYNALPVGIGPFRYVKWARGDRVELEANPYYWRGRPKLDRVIYRMIPDRNTLLTQVESGGIDLWPTIPPAFSDRVHGIAGFTTFTRPSFLYDHFDFNNDRPIFHDAAVRQALRLAIDRRVIAQKFGHGAVILQESVIPKATAVYDDVPLVPYDPAKARALLDAAGWRLGADGIRVKNGLRLVPEVASSAGAPDIDGRIELIRAFWQAIGVGLNSKHYANGQLFGAYTAGGILYGGKFDVIFFAWEADVTGETSSQYDSAFIPPAGQDVSHYRSRVADAAFDRFQISFDPAERLRLAKTIQERIAADAPVVVLDSRINTFVLNRDLKGYDPNISTPFDDMMKVDI